MRSTRLPTRSWIRLSTRRLSWGLAVTLIASFVLTGCSKKPTEDECNEFADHFVKLLEESRESPDARVKKLANSQRDKLIDACVDGGTKKEVECVLAQSSMVDVEANCK